MTRTIFAAMMAVILMGADESGCVGATGPKGDVGATGPKGDRGLTGFTGATGPKGDRGLTGFTGATGPQGPRGEPGSSTQPADEAQSGIRLQVKTYSRRVVGSDGSQATLYQTTFFYDTLNHFHCGPLEEKCLPMNHVWPSGFYSDVAHTIPLIYMVSVYAFTAEDSVAMIYVCTPAGTPETCSNRATGAFQARRFHRIPRPTTAYDGNGKLVDLSAYPYYDVSKKGTFIALDEEIPESSLVTLTQVDTEIR